MTAGLLLAAVAVGLASLIMLALLHSRLRRAGDEGNTAQLLESIAAVEKSQADSLARIEKSLKDDLSRLGDASATQARSTREELGTSIQQYNEAVLKRINEAFEAEKRQLDTFSNQLTTLTGSNESRMEKLRETVDTRLKEIQDDSSKKLEEMRATVDEKLQTTLERRLGESFKLVSERLETVQRGLGEMQALAADVGGLKKVLANVKTRGGWGEVQLGSLLEEILIPEQYAENVATKRGSRAFVEFAIKLPGRDDTDSVVWLPVDAKFPSDVYERLVDAQESADLALVERCGKDLETSIRTSAKDIAEKYLDPPNTTDFALLFVPTEGLYAELLRRPGFAALLQRDHRVVLMGPMTVAAFLNSLQMGFRTLAIQKRSSEVWRVLGAIKTEFSEFGKILGKVQKKLTEASNTIGTAELRARVITRKLKTVEELPAGEAAGILPPADPEADETEDEQPEEEEV